ncbi:hypothetical protein OKW28_004436 [Paraburkholderia sp. 40]
MPESACSLRFPTKTRSFRLPIFVRPCPAPRRCPFWKQAMSTIPARIERLPYSSFHRKLLWLGGLGYVFDAMDAAVLAFMLPVPDAGCLRRRAGSRRRSIARLDLSDGPGRAHPAGYEVRARRIQRIALNRRAGVPKAGQTPEPADRSFGEAPPRGLRYSRTLNQRGRSHESGYQCGRFVRR